LSQAVRLLWLGLGLELKLEIGLGLGLGLRLRLGLGLVLGLVIVEDLKLRFGSDGGKEERDTREGRVGIGGGEVERRELRLEGERERGKRGGRRGVEKEEEEDCEEESGLWLGLGLR
jgi:hypothetical protein